MNFSAIKTGRYTHEKKINDIMEIKSLSMVERNNAKLEKNTEIEFSENDFSIMNNSFIDSTKTLKKFEDKNLNENCDDFENFFELAQNNFQPYPSEQSSSVDEKFELNQQNQQNENFDFFQNICKQNLLRANIDFNNSKKYYSFDDPVLDNISYERVSYDDLNPFNKDLEDPFPDSLSYFNLDNINPKLAFEESQNLSLSIGNSPSSPITPSSSFVASFNSPSTFLSNDSSSPPSLYTNFSYEVTPQSLASFQPYVPDIAFSSGSLLPPIQSVSPTNKSNNFLSNFENLSVVPNITQKPKNRTFSRTFSDQELQEIVDKINLTRLKNSRWKEDFYERLPSIHQEYLVGRIFFNNIQC